MKTIYYRLKPFIPRQLQIFLRRTLVRYKRTAVSDIWPIDHRASQLPVNWSGWPEQKQFALILMHDVDTAKGHAKCRQLMELEKRLGFRSSFNFVPERYNVSPDLRHELNENGFEVGVHGLNHDGRLFSSRRIFETRAPLINNYLKEWNSVGFSSPSMHHNLDWMTLLNIEYAMSTFDTDPFEPQPEGVSTIFPFFVNNSPDQKRYIELPYTLPQDFTLFILMKERNIEIWKKKLDWIAEKGGMALINTHPDYMTCDRGKTSLEEYPGKYYEAFLNYLKEKYKGCYWHALPGDMARFWKSTMVEDRSQSDRQGKKQTKKRSTNIIQIIDPAKDPRWDKFVENHPFGWIVHLSGWKKVLENSFNHITGHYLTLTDSSSNHIKAALPLFEVRSRLLGNRLVSIPFATLCDPLISTSDDMTKLIAEAINLSKQLKIPSIEIRTLMSIPLLHEDSMGINFFYKHHYLILDKEPEELKRSFNRTNVRKGINKALRNNLVMKVADDESDLLTFYALHIKNRKKLGLPPQPYRFFKMLWDTFAQSGKMILILAKKDGQTIAGLISFKYKDRFSCEYLATDQRFLGVRPNNFLFWEAIKIACNEGFKVFDFGRTAPDNEGLMNFKNRWGTTMTELPHLYYPAKLSKNVGNQKTSPGYKLINKICENSPESVCKLLGQVCYKHLG